jgi:ACDE family multidrug resistance protein
MGWRISAQFLGNTAWPFLGGYLGTFSWHTPFAVYLLGIPVGITGLIALPDIHIEASEPPKQPGKQESVLRLIRNTPILFLIYTVAFLSMVFLFAMILFMPKIVEQFGVENPFYIGMFISALWLTAVITSLVYGRIKTLLSYRALLVIIMFFWVAGFFTMSQASSIGMIVLSVVLIGLSQGIVFPTITLWAGESVPMSFLGRIISYNTTVLFIGQFLSPIILSPIASSLGLNAVFIIIGGISAIMLVAFLISFRGRIMS